MWNVTLSPPAAARPRSACGLVDHHVHVEPAAEAVDERRDRLEHDRADRDRLDEVAVADVEVEHQHTGAHQVLDLLAEFVKSAP